ncbi:MAG: DUF4175 family protein [Bacteroidales bacterium]
MMRSREHSEEATVDSRLNAFLKRFYLVRMLQGFIITLIISLIYFGAAAVLSNLVTTGPVMGGVLFWLFFALLFWLLVVLVAIPAGRWLGWLKRMDYKEASRIITGTHGEIRDRIINIYELEREQRNQGTDLYLEAIRQKTEEIRWYDFNKALPVKELVRNLPWLAALVVMVVGSYALFPRFIKSGIAAVVYYNQNEPAKVVYGYRILNDSLKVVVGSDLTIEVQPNFDPGKERIGIRIGGHFDALLKENGHYRYTIKEVNRNLDFRFVYKGQESESHSIEVLMRPELVNLTVLVIPPAYTGLPAETIEGQSSIEIIRGSVLTWQFTLNHTDSVRIEDGQSTEYLAVTERRAVHTKKIASNREIRITCLNVNGLSVSYPFYITTTGDEHPYIRVAENVYEEDDAQRYVEGFIQDDFGFSRLQRIIERNGIEEVTDLEVGKDLLSQTFYHTLRIRDTGSFSYYFRVWDNDYEFGPKSTESNRLVVKMKTIEEVRQDSRDLADNVSKGLEGGISEVDRLLEKLNMFRLEQLTGELKPWEIAEKMKEINQLRENVESMIQMVEENADEYRKNEERLLDNQELLKRAEEIRDLLNSLIDDELRELMEQFKKLAEEMKDNEFKQMNEMVELSMEKLREQMEMSLELLKKYDIESRLMQQINDLENLAEKTDELKEGEETKAEEIREEVEKWNTEYEKNLEENEGLKDPIKADPMEEEREEMQEWAEEMKDKKGEEFKEANKSSSKKMKQVADKMKQMLQMSSEGGEMVDLEHLRQIRNSLIDFSIKQEDLNRQIAQVNVSSPVYKDVITGQKLLETKFRIVRDSLRSMGYRQPMIAKVIGEEVFHVETSLVNLFKSYADIKINQVRIEQNKIMNNVNSIALKLDEMVSRMQDAQGATSGNKGFTDSKPKKSGEEEVGEMKQKQQSLKEQLKGMIQKMGDKGKGGQQRQEMARMLQEREMMRKAMESLSQGGSIGQNAREKLQHAIEMMKQVEKDIIYDQVNENTLKRDELITTRLLEAEQSERERENDNKRESNEFKGEFQPMIKPLDESEKPERMIEELMRYREIRLKRFYQEKYEEYLKRRK